MVSTLLAMRCLGQLRPPHPEVSLRLQVLNPPPPPPVDICRVIGGKKDCKPRPIPPGPVTVPVNLFTLSILEDACGEATISTVGNCKNNLRFLNLALMGDGCARFRSISDTLCAELSDLADGKEHVFSCGSPTGETGKGEGGRVCCGKVSFSGTYPTIVNVDFLIPFVCHISGTVTADITVDGKVGQCKDKKRR